MLEMLRHVLRFLYMEPMNGEKLVGERSRLPGPSRLSLRRCPANHEIGYY